MVRGGGKEGSSKLPSYYSSIPMLRGVS